MSVFNSTGSVHSTSNEGAGERNSGQPHSKNSSLLVGAITVFILAALVVAGVLAIKFTIGFPVAEKWLNHVFTHKMTGLQGFYFGLGLVGSILLSYAAYKAISYRREENVKFLPPLGETIYDNRDSLSDEERVPSGSEVNWH